MWPDPQRGDHRRLVHQRAARGVHQDRRRAAAARSARRSGSRASRRSAAGAATARGFPPAACRGRRTSRRARTWASGSRPSPACRRRRRCARPRRRCRRSRAGRASCRSVAAPRCAASRRARMPPSIAAMPRAAAHIRAMRVLGHRGVAVALDDVHGDAEVSQFLRVHVAARAGAEEDDVLQAAAARASPRSASGVWSSSTKS